MLPLAAYADRLSVRPGDKIQFHVANATGHPVHAKVVRVICADANPAGPGIQTEPVDAALVTVSEPGPQHTPQGSYAIVDGLAPPLQGRAFTWLFRAFPTYRSAEPQSLMSLVGASTGEGLSVYLDGDGMLALGSGVTGEPVLRVGRALNLRRWHAIWLNVDPASGRVVLGAAPMNDAMALNREPVSAEARFDAGNSLSANDLTLLVAAAGRPDRPEAHFTGKFENPVLFTRVLSDEEIHGYAAGTMPDDSQASWDFALEVSSSRIVDTGASGLHGRLVNCPSRGMTGSNWSGREMSYQHAPAEYGAIHFHADDLDDCCWPVVYQWTVPAGCRSAVYALELETGGERDARENVPFHVVPPRGRRNADIAVLASTLTYTIYGNHARPEWDRNPQFREDWHKQAAEWGAYPYNPGDHREYGLSTYNDHIDGSGISIASWHRPMLNVRVGYITYPYESIRASGLRHFPADSHLVAWLEAMGHGYDIITDWELHTEGVALLEDYPVVMTGSHPEYHTPPMLDALEAYRDGGGRLCYMGGNGFYWKLAANPERDGAIEIRRGEGGIRAWAAEPGEYYNQFDGEYGGMWRRNGRPPQHLCGVGFTAQGNFSGSHYRKRPEADGPRVAWMFEGVDGEVFGDHGLSGHGAAGFELDRADKLLGTPAHAVVAASSENHPPEVPWILVPEEILTHLATVTGEPAQELIRADLTFFETPAGGAVFSTGSITFCGSLVTDSYDNDVSRLVSNVLRRFLDPAPFEMPSQSKR